jgi:hypothetical protein
MRRKERPAMTFFRDHKCLSFVVSFVVVLTLLTWLVPYATAYLYDPADENQHQCVAKGQRTDPMNIPRPGYVGKVLKIRLTDDGEFVDRCELSDVLFELNWDWNNPEFARSQPRPPVIPGAPKYLPKFVVLYIHGWKHTASNDDKDFGHFSELISELAQNNKNKKQVLGVYVGWNASSKVPPFNWPPFNNLTFWSKETIADRIAQSTVITRILSSINSIMSELKHPAANQFVVVGHSFGARMLFSATAQSLIYDTEKAHPGYDHGNYRSIRGIANAVILLNSAFEAARYSSLNAITRTQENFSEDQLPLLLSISSKADWATKEAFPVGQWLGFYRSERELTTLGNYKNYQTHSLQPKDADGCDSASNNLSEHFFSDGLCLIREKPSKSDQISQPSRNPFLIARASASVINGHNDIWEPHFKTWLFDYIRELGQQRRPRLLDGDLGG